MSVPRPRQESRRRRVYRAAAVFAAGLLVSGALFLSRKSWIGWTAERVLAAALGVDADVTIQSVEASSAEAAFRGRIPKLELSRVHLRWTVRHWWPLDVTAFVRAEEESLPLGSARALDLRLDGEAAFRGSVLRAAEVHARARTLETDRAPFAGAALDLSLGPESLFARGSARSPLGPVEIELKGGAPDLSSGFAGKGTLSAKAPGLSARSRWEAKFGSGFVEGKASLSDLELGGAWLPPFLAGPRFHVVVDKHGADAKVTAELPAGTWAGLTTSAPLAVELDLTSAGVGFQGAARGSPWGSAYGVRVASVEAKGHWSPTAVDFFAHAAGVESPDVLLPVDVSVWAEGPPERVRVTGEVKDLLQDVWVSARGEWTPRGLDLKWEKEFSLAGGAFDPSNLTPLAEGLKPRSGTLRVAGHTRVSQGALRLSGGARFTDVAFDLEGVPCEGLNGQVELDRIYPPRLGRRAQIRVASLGSVVPFKQVEIELAPAGAAVRVEKLAAHWGDGHVTADPFTASVLPPAFATKVTVDRVDAESLLKDAAAGQLKASGVLAGVVPLDYRDGFLRIEHGSLGAKKGWIQYKDPTVAGLTEPINYLDQFEDLLARGQQALAFKALDNFHFDELSMALTRHPDTLLAVRLTLSGRNPELANGMPFQFHIGLSGQLESAMKQSFLKGLMRPEAFTEYLKKRK